MNGAPEEGFLEQLADADRRALLERGVRRRFAAGAALAHQRQAPERVLLLLEGHVKVMAVDEEGREALLALRGPGDLLGELSALDGLPLSASIVALEQVEALALPAGAFQAFLAERSGAAMLLLRMLAGRLRDADAKRAEFARADTIGRLAARLLELASGHGEDDGEGRVRIALPLSQDDLAGWTGASREAVGRALATLRGCGWVETGRRRIVVCDRDALERLSA